MGQEGLKKKEWVRKDLRRLNGLGRIKEDGMGQEGLKKIEWVRKD